MIKNIFGFEFPNEPSALIVTPSYSLQKTAYGTNVQLQDFLNKLEPDEKYAHVLVNIMGTGEVWGPNSNSDYFSHGELMKSYKTFEKDGMAYRHHVNKDPSKACGKVVLAMFNPDMHRVELVKKLPINMNEDILSKIERGDRIGVSMGCKIDYDVCSWCGNKAKTKKDYCDHVKFQRGQWRDGLACYMDNINPRFFDSSFVTKPADRSAYLLAKVAEDGASATADEYPLSVVLGEQIYGQDPETKEAEASKKAKYKKVADIDKEIPATITGTGSLSDLYGKFRQSGMPSLRDKEAEFTTAYLNEIAKYAEHSLATLASHGVILKPKEFQRVALVHAGRKDLADKFESGKHIFDETHPDTSYKFDMGNYNHDLAKKLLAGILLKSYFRNALYNRIYSNQSGEGMVANPVAHDACPIHDGDKPVMAAIGGSFIDYKEKAKELAMLVASGVRRLFPHVTNVSIKLASLHPSTYRDSYLNERVAPVGVTGVAFGMSEYKAASEYSVKVTEENLKTAYRMSLSGESLDNNPLFKDLAIIAGSIR